jgi:hypothetical protein
MPLWKLRQRDYYTTGHTARTIPSRPSYDVSVRAGFRLTGLPAHRSVSTRASQGPFLPLCLGLARLTLAAGSACQFHQPSRS